MRILMTGGTGLLGNAIGRRIARANQVIVLSREGKNAKSRVSYPCELLAWDGRSEISPRWLEGVEGLIHLAGENIGQGRWTEERKQALRDSRLQPLEQIDRALRAHNRQLRVLISASGVGYYGNRGDEELTEASSAGEDFLARLCVDWEKAALALPSKRSVILRLGPVLAADTGFIKEVVSMFKKFGAARLGSGQHFLSWIHIDDAAEIVSQALTNPFYSGPINAVAPEALRNSDWTDKLAEATGSFKIPAGAPVFALKMMFGEMAEMMLSSQKVKPAKLQNQKFQYRYPTFESALKRIFAPTEPSPR